MNKLHYLNSKLSGIVEFGRTDQMRKAIGNNSLVHLDKLAPFPYSRQGITRRDLLSRIVDDNYVGSAVSIPRGSRDSIWAGRLLKKGPVKEF